MRVENPLSRHVVLDLRNSSLKHHLQKEIKSSLCVQSSYMELIAWKCSQQSFICLMIRHLIISSEKKKSYKVYNINYCLGN